MGQATILRILTKKSQLRFGKHFDLLVGDVFKLEIKGVAYLAWTYYNCSNISFCKEVLAELKINERLQIKKPGTIPFKYYEWKDSNLEEKDRLILYTEKTSNKKFKRIRASKFDSIKFSAKNLQLINHGKF